MEKCRVPYSILTDSFTPDNFLVLRLKRISKMDTDAGFVEILLENQEFT